MAIYGKKQQKLEEKQHKDKAYLSYFEQMSKNKKQPMTRYHWEKSGRRVGYGETRGGTSALAKLTRKERKRVGLPD